MVPQNPPLKKPDKEIKEDTHTKTKEHKIVKLREMVNENTCGHRVIDVDK